VRRRKEFEVIAAMIINWHLVEGDTVLHLKLNDVLKVPLLCLHTVSQYQPVVITESVGRRSVGFPQEL
jgi:hypothetical protein